MMMLSAISLAYFLLHTADSTGVLECFIDNDCGVSGAKCISNLCECQQGYTLSTNATLCLKYVTEFKGDCVDKAQCAWLLGDYVCSEGVCDCNSGWHWSKGRCVEYKRRGDVCTEDSECFDGYDYVALKCTDGRCGCNDNYYLRGDYDCRLAALNIGDECALDFDCKFDSGSCVNGRCQIADVEEKNISLNHHSSNIHIRDLIADQDCGTDGDCTQTTNSVCSPLTKKCICPRGYFLSTNNACVGELGVDVGCTADSDCAIKPGKCVEGACYCTSYRYYGDDMRRCFKSMTQTNWNCVSDEWCYALGADSYCNEDGACACKPNAFLDGNNICRVSDDQVETEDECHTCDFSLKFHCVDGRCLCFDNYREENGKCLPNIGAECDDTFPCTIDRSSCSNVCTCDDNYIPFSNTICLAVASTIGDECVEDIQCTEILPNSGCTEGACACISNYTNKNGTCYELKSMGSYCAKSSDCTAVMGANVQCRNSKCQCSVDMEATDDGMDCRVPSGAAPISPLQISLSVIVIFLLDYLF